MKRRDLAGLGFIEEPERNYPEGELASHVLGFMGADYQGGAQGYYGVISEEKTAQGEPIIIGGYQRVNPVDGRTLYLTIDRSVQNIVESHLISGVKKNRAQSGSVV